MSLIVTVPVGRPAAANETSPSPLVTPVSRLSVLGTSCTRSDDIWVSKPAFLLASRSSVRMFTCAKGRRSCALIVASPATL